jgi:hypothetical protein
LGELAGPERHQHGTGCGDHKNITVTRHTRFGFYKGTRISVLEDPQGNPWVM